MGGFENISFHHAQATLELDELKTRILCRSVAILEIVKGFFFGGTWGISSAKSTVSGDVKGIRPSHID